MTETTPRTALPLLAAAQAQKHVTHNEALLQLDALLFARFLDRDLAAPPASPADGDTYLVAAPATGDWTGADGQIAFAVDGAWRLYAPFTGLAAFVVDEAKLIVFNGSSWVDYATILSLQNLPLVGVNTSADMTNKLAVKSSALLFDNIGNGVQAKLNKHASADTASLLYQTNYSGRAEIGLCGDDNFHFKVSPDGSSWFDGFDIAAADGSVDFAASETTLASAATTDLGTASSLRVLITGTTTVAAFGTRANRLRFVRFAGALTLTHNATSLILLGGASRATAAGDVGIYTSDASGNWRERSYRRAASDPGDMATKSGSETLTNKTVSGVTLSGATTLPGSGGLDSSGNLGLGIAASASYRLRLKGGSTAYAAINFVTQGNGYGEPVAVGSLSDGDKVVFLNSGTAKTAWGADSNNGHWFQASAGTANPALRIMNGVSGVAPATLVAVYGSGDVRPGSDNTQNLGSASYRWATVYAGTGSINTSGARTKQDVRTLSEAERAVATALAANVRLFRFRDAVADKGKAARLHAGMIFEDVVAAFAAHGLDPFAYGIVCRDPSEEGDVLGLRYGELTQFVLAGLSARLAALESHLPHA